MKDRLDELTRGLPRGVAPKRDLWPGIEGHLRSVRVRRARKYRVAAGLLLLACGLGTYFSYLEVFQPSTSRTNPVSSVGAITAMPARPVQLVDRELAAVNHTMVKIQRALRRDPDNPQLYEFLYTAYRQKTWLLHERSKLTVLGS